MGGDAKSADIEKAIRQTLKFLNPTNRLFLNSFVCLPSITLKGPYLYLV